MTIMKGIGKKKSLYEGSNVINKMKRNILMNNVKVKEKQAMHYTEC